MWMIEDYARLLGELKERIHTAQVKAALAVNRELIRLYWDLGRVVLEKTLRGRWGTGIIARLSRDLRAEFPELRGLSPQNIRYMRLFFSAWSGQGAICQQPVGELNPPIRRQAAAKLSEAGPPEPLESIPWGHNIVLLEKVSSPAERLWYARQAAENGWSRAVLVHQIDSRLHLRQGKALTNFKRTLPEPQSDLAQEVIKDDYAFDFLASAKRLRERDLERGLLDHVQRFLLELGTGFAFVGRQYHLEVGGEDFYLDLLFYHLRLSCFVVVELKTGPFKPEHAGKMSFYLSAADDLLRRDGDGPTIGIILCQSKNKVVAEYALLDSNKPIGVSSFRATRTLPEDLAAQLPKVDELESRLGGPGDRSSSG